MRARLTILLGAALLAAGCGGGSSDDEAIRDVVATFVKAGNDDDWAAVCRLFTPSARSELTRGGQRCPDVLRSAAGGQSTNTTAKIEKVTIKGESATAVARVTQSDGTKSRQRLRLQRQQGEWQISGFGN